MAIGAAGAAVSGLFRSLLLFSFRFRGTGLVRAGTLFFLVPTEESNLGELKDRSRLCRLCSRQDRGREGRIKE